MLHGIWTTSTGSLPMRMTIVNCSVPLMLPDISYLHDKPRVQLIAILIMAFAHAAFCIIDMIGLAICKPRQPNQSDLLRAATLLL